MSRPITSVHVDIARFVLEVSEISADSAESLEKKIADWTRGLAKCLAMRDPSLHPYGAHLLSEVEQYRIAETERKRAKFSALSKESAESQPRTDQNRSDRAVNKKNKKEEGARAPARFTPPTLDEVRAYCTERKNSVDPEKWWHHYGSNGWRVGKNPMKSWKSAIITWEKNHVAHQGNPSGRGTQAERNARAAAENYGPVFNAEGEHD
jgi:hypothetical protein